MQALNLKQSNDDRHPFAGCGRLLSHYSQVGSALLRCESKISRRGYGFIGSTESTDREFAVLVTSVPLEVLESYLDDVLDPDISDEQLFISICRSTARRLGVLMVVFGAIGYFLSEYAKQSYTSLARVGVISCIIFSVLAGAFLIPRTSGIRRFAFATLISREITRRRGNDGTARQELATGNSKKSFLFDAPLAAS